MQTLTEIGKLYNTDKVPHGYLPHYERRFRHLRQEPITLLEIGVWDGKSLKTWRDFFPQGQIYGLDLVPEHIVTDERIESFLGDQSDAVFLAKVAKATGPLDFVVDDGGHRADQHIASFDVLWQHIKPGGWYCIEDAFTLFNECWTQKDDRTILDVLHDQWEQILRGTSDIQEVAVIGGGPNDGLIFMRKRSSLPER